MCYKLLSLHNKNLYLVEPFWFAMPINTYLLTYDAVYEWMLTYA